MRSHPGPSIQPSSSSTLRTDILISLAIFVLALTVRLLYLFQIESIPLFYHLASDGRSYDEWAQRIATGDWLGQGVFYQAPLYPYFLGVLQFLMGRDLWLIRVVQIILGAASCVLLYWVGRSFFSRGAGIASGLILSLYAPAIFFDALIQKTVLDLFLISLLLLLLSRAQSTYYWIHWLAVGAVTGLLGLSRENALVWALVLPIWIWLYFVARPPQVRLRWVAVFLTGLIVVLLPVGLRNLKVGGEFTLTTSQLGPNLFIGNNPAADGTYAPLRPGRGDPQFERQDATELAEQAVGRSLSPGEVSSYWLGRSFDYILSEPIDWLWLMWRKWLVVWNVRELEDAEDFYLYQRWSWLLRALGWTNHFGLLAPLAAVGFVVSWHQWRKLWLLYLLLATLAFSVALFYVFGRYRFPMVPLLTIFAGAGLVEGFTLLREGKVHEGLVCASMLILTAAVVHWPLIGRPEPSAAGFSNLGNALAKQGRIDEAIESYQEALKVLPTYAEAHYNLGNVLVKQGKFDEATHHYREAVRIHPDFAEAYSNLGDVFMRRDELESAIQQFRTALKINPNRAEFHFNMATALAKREKLAEAAEHLQRALRLVPNFAEAFHRLGMIMAAQGDLAEAVLLFQRALRIKPDFAEAHESLGQALAQQGKRDEGIKHYEEALRIMRSRFEARNPR